MTEKTVKEFIKSYSELKARKDILDKIRECSDDEYCQKEESDKEYSQLIIKIQIIESALEILTKDEKKIILLHLIENVKWSEVILIYEKQVGEEFNHSERTFIRMQKKALKKIEDFISEHNIEQYIN